MLRKTKNQKGDTAMNIKNDQDRYVIEELESRLEMITPTGDCTCHCGCAADN
jgi:hypothetical protein